MFLSLLKGPWLALRHGPIAWIPFIIALPVCLVVSLLLIAGYVLLLPIILTWCYLSMRSFQRRAGVFSDDGIYFPKAYGRLMIMWPDICEVVLTCEPKVAFYRITYGSGQGNALDVIMSSTPDNDAFERALRERRIPFRVQKWFERIETGAEQVAAHESPLPVSGSGALVQQTLDSLPAPGSGGDR